MKFEAKVVLHKLNVNALLGIKNGNNLKVSTASKSNDKLEPSERIENDNILLEDMDTIFETRNTSHLTRSGFSRNYRIEPGRRR